MIFNKYIHYSIYIIASVFFAFSIDLSFPDDGLRHIAFASNKQIMQSWGNVYPYSLFDNYDPWFSWHFLLNILMNIVSYEKIHILINILVLFFLMILTDLNIRRYSNYNFSSLLYILVFVITVVTSFRYVMLRPDLLSGLFVLSALLIIKRFKTLFLLTFFYSCSYYLFFIYTGSIGLVYLIQKRIKAFFIVLIASIIGLCFHLIYDYESYLKTIKNILTDQSLRMGLAVQEGVPIFDFLDGFNYYILLPIFLIGSFIIIWFNYEYFKKNTLALFLIITSILWINQYRYYHLFLPLLVIFVLTEITKIDKKKFFYNLRKYFVLMKQYFNYSKNKSLFYIIAIAYSILMLSYIFSSQSLNESINQGKFFKEDRFNNKTILSNKMDTDMFKAHYFNPNIKLIPSCSIGWFTNKDEKMKNLYVKLQGTNTMIKEEELRELIDYTKSDFYMHYFNTKHKLNFQKLSSLGIIALELDSKKILFKIQKDIK